MEDKVGGAGLGERTIGSCSVSSSLPQIVLKSLKYRNSQERRKGGGKQYRKEHGSQLRVDLNDLKKDGDRMMGGKTPQPHYRT